MGILYCWVRLINFIQGDTLLLCMINELDPHGDTLLSCKIDRLDTREYFTVGKMDRLDTGRYFTVVYDQ